MRILAAFFFNTAFNFAIGLLVALYLGPDQFGRFALAMVVGTAAQLTVYEWIRFAAIRFYSERSRQEQPGLRATLDMAFAAASVVMGAAAAVLTLSGMTFSLSDTLFALAFGIAVVNGLFDYQTALVRARFQDQLYGRLVLCKNILALFLTVGGAFIFKSATMTLAGACISMASTVILARMALRDAAAKPSLASFKLALELGRYSAPIVAANLLYLAIILANRTLLTSANGFSETGQFSLAFDIGIRLMLAIGSSMDVLLFQIAVRTEETHGRAMAHEQIAQNMATVFAILMPSAAGLWLILPSLEILIVPPAFRGPFGYYLTLLLPGLLAFALINFALNAFFQIGKKTLPLIAAALAGCIVDGVLLLVLPVTADASRFAIAQTGAFLSSMCVLAGFAWAAGASWPRARDIILVVLATALMVAALLPMRAMTPGLVTGAAQIIVGGLIFGACVFAFDIALLRTAVVTALRRWL